jgi:hypothetical protein
VGEKVRERERGGGEGKREEDRRVTYWSVKALYSSCPAVSAIKV